MPIPRIISVDDHVIEAPTLWTDRIAAKYRDRVPHVETTRVSAAEWRNGDWVFTEEPDNPDAQPASVWIYEGTRKFLVVALCALGDRDALDILPRHYDYILPGSWQQEARLADLDQNRTEASLCFPSISRFCGQYFMNREDPELALECVRIYNNWMIEEWCGGAAKGRLIPLTMIPMWDPILAAAEVRRCADKGSHAIAFSEQPADLGLPSLYSGKWDPFIAACEETDTVINMHIGSSSRFPTTAPDAPHLVSTVLGFENGMHAALDWILSGRLAMFPNLRIALSEAQIGWLPYVAERLDKAWLRNRAIDQQTDSLHDLVSQTPSSYIPGRIFGCVFDDEVALKSRDVIGMKQLLFETDYPHADSTWDYSTDIAVGLAEKAGLSDYELWQFMRGNAIEAYHLDQYFGITKDEPPASAKTTREYLSAHTPSRRLE